jgi:MFS family permease
LFVVILAASFFIFSPPGTNKSPGYILNWYSSNTHKDEVFIATLLADIAVVFGLFWFGYLRDRFGRADFGGGLSPVLLAGAVVFAAGGLVFSGAQFALVDQPKKMLPATAQTLNFLAADIGVGAVTVGLSVVMWAAGFIIFRTRILPRWMAWVSFVLAVVALAGPIGFFAFIATGVWILIVAFFMWRYEQRLSASGGNYPLPSPAAPLSDPQVPAPKTETASG